MQSAMMQILYKGIFRWFLKLIVGVQFPDTRFLRKEGQFIILANHNSHLDTLSLLSSLPGNLLWKIKPVAAEDYFGRTRFQACFQQLLHQHPSHQKKRRKGLGARPTPENARCHAMKDTR